MDEQGVVEFLMKLAGDAAAAAGGLSVAIGDRLGLYPAMAGAGPLTAAELAQRTGLVERYMEEWLAVQAGLGYVEYDQAAQTFTLPDEHAAVLADENSPTFLAGVFPVLRSLYATEDRLVNAFRVGGGVGWDEHSDPLYRGTARLFRPGYRQNIVDAWLPALDGVVERLRAGARVADIGCGYGYSTIIMAEAFPKSTFTGIDYHAPSLDAAAKAASEAGVGDRVSFQVAGGGNFRGTTFEPSHLLRLPARHGRPAGSRAPDTGGARGRRHMDAGRSRRRAAGSRRTSTPSAGSSWRHRSPCACRRPWPSTVRWHWETTQAARAALAVQSAGFSRWRRVAETPVNVVYEARP